MSEPLEHIPIEKGTNGHWTGKPFDIDQDIWDDAMDSGHPRPAILAGAVMGKRDPQFRVPCCPDWPIQIEILNGPIILQSVRAGRILYQGKPFEFCPWCGTKLTRKAGS